MNDGKRTPESLGEFLRAHVRHARKTSKRHRQVSRVDAVCWFLVNYGCLASPSEVKRFVTAFKGEMATYSHYDRKAKRHGTREGLERCYALLNTAYGGVGTNFSGEQRVCMTGSHYGAVAPLYRPMPRRYAPTISGIQRAARVDSILSAPSSTAA